MNGILYTSICGEPLLLRWNIYSLSKLEVVFSSHLSVIYELSENHKVCNETFKIEQESVVNINQKYLNTNTAVIKYRSYKGGLTL